MNRRKFLNNTVKACAATLLTDGLWQKAFASSSMLQAIQASCTDNVLVIIQLAGGNDGLNTVIPLNQYSALSVARKNILIPESKVLSTKAYSGTGFHPSFSGFHSLFESNMAAVVQGCSYEDPDFSHFRATDIIMSGSDANEYLPSGWIGRELEQLYPNFPAAYPNTTMPDPLAIQAGSITNLTLDGVHGLTGIAVSNITSTYNMTTSFGDVAANSRAGNELKFLRDVSNRTSKYNTRILVAANAQKTNISTLYGTDELSQNLKNISRLIKGGMKTRVYMVTISGFDTHSNQTEEGNTTIGVHAKLLQSLSSAISGFQDDITKMGVNKRVTGLVFSEFGRRIKSNASLGTDHGAGMPMFLFGSELKGGMYGTNPVIPMNATVRDNVAMQHDYRSVYYSLLKDWFCLSKSQLDSVFGNKTYPYLSLFKPGSIVANAEDVYLEERTDALKEIYPNPMDENGIISFNSSGGQVKMEILDLEGRPVRTLMEKAMAAGSHQLRIEREELKKGIYIVQMRNGTFQASKKVVFK